MLICCHLQTSRGLWEGKHFDPEILMGRSVLVSAASASAWLLPPLSSILGIDQKMDHFWHSWAGRCWSGGEGFAKAWEIGESLSITKCNNIGELQLETISVERRLGMAKVQTPEVLPVLFLSERRLKNGGASGESASCWFRRNHFALKTQWSYGVRCHVQGSPASKHPVGLPKEKPSQMLSITGEREW